MVALQYFDTPIALVRALIPDTEEVPNANRPYDPPEYIFSDQHLTAFLEMNNGNVRLAASDACAALATSEGYIAKVIKTEDLATDGAKLMLAMLQRAKMLREQAKDDTEDMDGETTIVGFVRFPGAYDDPYDWAM